MNIKISYIVPIYNTSNSLKKCLDSLLLQTFQNIEVIMVNDGSSDNSEEICLNYTKNNTRFKYFFKENGGLSSARNFGILKAQGDYIFFLDSDDYIAPNSGELLFKAANENQADIVNFGYFYVKDKLEDKRQSVLPKNTILNHSDILELLKYDTVKNKFLWFSWTYFIKTSFLMKNNILFKENVLLGEDSDFNLRLLLTANKIYNISDPLYFYVYNENSLTQSTFRKDLLPKFSVQFEERISVYKDFNIFIDPYTTDIAQNYLEHSLIEILSNFYRNKNLDTNGLDYLKTLRESKLFEFCCNNYKKSVYLTRGKNAIIYLFKKKYLRVLDILLKIKLK
ncbi:glycosyltransferase [Gaetbulibacter sp. M240]|uniref:glycosyltransferase family 2 protein n=1 Tax=Gaetbulibacter sp. M240 TaxID=3126511 RepID=UPI00374FD5BC